MFRRHFSLGSLSTRNLLFFLFSPFGFRHKLFPDLSLYFRVGLGDFLLLSIRPNQPRVENTAFVIILDNFVFLVPICYQFLQGHD